MTSENEQGADAVRAEPEGSLTCSKCGRKVFAVKRDDDGDLCWRCV